MTGLGKQWRPRSACLISVYTVCHSVCIFWMNYSVVIWACARQNKQNDLCAQPRLRSAWVSAQTDQSSLCTQWVAKDPRLLHADNKDSDQTWQMPRPIWVFAGRIAAAHIMFKGVGSRMPTICPVDCQKTQTLIWWVQAAFLMVRLLNLRRVTSNLWFLTAC